MIQTIFWIALSMWHWKEITLCLYWMIQMWLSVCMCDQTLSDELWMHPSFWQRLCLLVYEKEDVGRLMLYQMSGPVYFTLYCMLTVWLALRGSQSHAKTVLQRTLSKDVFLFFKDEVFEWVCSKMNWLTTYNMQYTVCYLILKNKLYIKQNTICYHKRVWIVVLVWKNIWNWNQTFLYFNKKTKKSK